MWSVYINSERKVECVCVVIDKDKCLVCMCSERDIIVSGRWMTENDMLYVKSNSTIGSAIVDIVGVGLVRKHIRPIV